MTQLDYAQFAFKNSSVHAMEIEGYKCSKHLSASAYERVVKKCYGERGCTGAGTWEEVGGEDGCIKFSTYKSAVLNEIHTRTKTRRVSNAELMVS